MLLSTTAVRAGTRVQRSCRVARGAVSGGRTSFSTLESAAVPRWKARQPGRTGAALYRAGPGRPMGYLPDRDRHRGASQPDGAAERPGVGPAGPPGRGSAVVSESFNSNTVNLLVGITLPALIAGIAAPAGSTELTVWWLAGITALTVVFTGYRGGLRRGRDRGGGTLPGLRRRGGGRLTRQGLKPPSGRSERPAINRSTI